MINITLQGTERTSMSGIERRANRSKDVLNASTTSTAYIYGTNTRFRPPTEQNSYARHTDWLGVQTGYSEIKVHYE